MNNLPTFEVTVSLHYSPWLSMIRFSLFRQARYKMGSPQRYKMKISKRNVSGASFSISESIRFKCKSISLKTKRFPFGAKFIAHFFVSLNFLNSKVKSKARCFSWVTNYQTVEKVRFGFSFAFFLLA